MNSLSNTQLSRAVRLSAAFAAPVALVAFARVVVAVVRGSAPVAYLILVPLLGFGIFFLLALILQLSGAVSARGGNELDVNIWFAWALCGALVSFFVGALVRAQNVLAGNEARIGLYTALAWVALVVVAWFVTRLVRARGA